MGCYLFIVVTNGCYLFSGLIKEFYLFRGMIKELVVDFWGFTPSVGLNMDFIPSVGWIWVLPHQWYIFLGLYPHLLLVWRALSSSIVCLKGFIPICGSKGFILIRGLFEGLYPICGLFEGLHPHLWFVWRALPHLWFVWRASSPSVVCLKGFIPISSSFERLYPDSVLIHLQGCYPQ